MDRTINMPRAGVCAAAFLAVGALMIGGCASAGRTAGPPSAAATITGVDYGALPIFDGPTGLRTSWDSLVAACSRADVVLIGEMHGHPAGLAVAARLYEEVSARRPNTAALSMEFLERDRQTALDDYLAGITDESGFRHAAGRTDKNYPAGHRAMVEAAHEHGQPIVASNAPRRYVTLARKEGFDRLRELTAEQRRLFVIPESLTEGAYRDSFLEMMSGMTGHGSGDGADEQEQTPEERAEAEAAAKEMAMGFFRAQNLWDATMAEAIAHVAMQGRSPVFHVVGQFHVDHGGGLTERVRSLLPGSEVIVVSMSPENASERGEDEADRADWIVHVGPAPE
ncbi:MAG: ChaN family lipoprotein [Phycisphaeraceae bacterium]|nr:ChaN family lipoprotein [Phycisphaeraceae bacterium]MCB9847016.1 ChaN family lipoprotein [Phycisphaeraceae bacterium]